MASIGERLRVVEGRVSHHVGRIGDMEMRVFQLDRDTRLHLDSLEERFTRLEHRISEVAGLLEELEVRVRQGVDRAT